MSAPEVIKLAILAVGGQGGGVLTGWLVALAEANGWRVQSTVVAGVAQRTGATIYYLEMAPAGERAPVFALAPAAGDVDILIAAELMEAGRAVMRGFVTPDRTTLIASTHRTHAVSEKIVPGDGQAPEAEVFAAMETAAKRLIAADYQQAAVDAGSVISASLFGAIAGSGALPFPRESFVDVIEASGRGVDASLRAFEAGAAGDTPRPTSRYGARRGRKARPACWRNGPRWRPASRNCRRRCGRWRKPVCAMSSTSRTRPTARSTSTAWIALWRQTAAITRSPSPPPNTSPTPWLMTT